MTYFKTLLLTLAFSSSIKFATSDDTETQQGMNRCVPCEGEIDENLSFDGVSCSKWLAVAGSAPADSAQCAFDRMVGIWFCGCPVPDRVEETCTLCPDGSTAFNASKNFPDSSITCDDISAIPAIDGDQTCNELLQMGSYCECQTQVERCDICPDGGEPANLDREFLTTGETCAYVMDVLDVSPKTDCNMYLPDLMVDVSSFCGCPGAEPPKQCNLCPDGAHVANEDKPIIYVPGATCGDFEAYTAYITDDTLCDYMHQVISMECCEGVDPVQQDAKAPEECNFCPDGNAVTFPNRQLIGLNMTCAELANRKDDEKDCVDLYNTEFDMMVDTGIYCGCPEVEPTGVCDFCPPGTSLLHPEREIHDGVKIAGATCAEYAALALSTFDEAFCGAMQTIGQVNECCGAVPGQEVETTNTTKPEDEQNETSDMCQLCKGGASISDTEKTFLGTEVTCQSYHEQVAEVPAGEECDSIFGDFNDTFNPQIYCGCPEAEPINTCNVCPEGSMVVDPNIYITDIFTTCGQLEDVAASTTNDEFCSSLKRVGEYYCCWSKETGKRNLRNSSVKVEDLMSDHHQRQYHFSALNAFEGIVSTVADVVDGKLHGPVDHDAGDQP